MTNPQSIRGSQLTRLLGGRFVDRDDLVPFAFQIGSGDGGPVAGEPPGEPTNLRGSGLATTRVESLINPITGSFQAVAYTAGNILWDAPSDTGGGPITGYEIEVVETITEVRNGSTVPDPPIKAYKGQNPIPVGPVTSYQIGGQGANQIYVFRDFASPGNVSAQWNFKFRVRALNEHGPGGWSGVLSLNQLTWSYEDPGGGEPPIDSTPPGQIAKPTATAGTLSIEVDWDRPIDGGTVTGYDLFVQSRPFPIHSSTTTQFEEVNPEHSGLTTSYTHSSLDSNRQYRYYVRATGPGGNGPPSLISPFVRPNASTASPLQVPGQVTKPTLTASDAALKSTWAEPTGTITSYQYQLRKDGVVGSTTTHSSLTRSLDLTSGIVNGSNYEIRWRARNSAASNGSDSSDRTAGLWSPWSDTATPQDAAITAPRNVSASAGDKQVGLLWNKPNDPRSPTTYNLQYQTRSASASDSWNTILTTGGPPRLKYPVMDISSYSGSATNYTHTGLTNGNPYRYRIRAVIGTTNGEWSDWTDPVTPKLSLEVPGVPSSIGAVAGNETARISFGPPTSGGLASYFEYEHAIKTSGPASPSWTGRTKVGASARTAVITGLTNGIVYLFRIRAGNDSGTSDWIVSADAGVTPAGPPLAPTRGPRVLSLIEATVGNARVAIVGTVFAYRPSNNGSVVTGYVWDVHKRASSASPNTPWTEVLEDQSNSSTIARLNLPTTSRDPHFYRFRFAAVNAKGTGPKSVWTISDTAI